jgi:hypothetical protein
MDEDTASHEIARLELQIEALAAAIERCRKIAFAAKTAIAGGALWFVLALLWILPFNPTYFVGALAATLGGGRLVLSIALGFDADRIAIAPPGLHAKLRFVSIDQRIHQPDSATHEHNRGDHQNDIHGAAFAFGLFAVILIGRFALVHLVRSYLGGRFPHPARWY